MGLDSGKIENVTSLYHEMNICAEYLHCRHEEFLALPKQERLKWYCFAELRAKKEKYYRDKQKDKTRDDANKAKRQKVRK